MMTNLQCFYVFNNLGSRFPIVKMFRVSASPSVNSMLLLLLSGYATLLLTEGSEARCCIGQGDEVMDL